MKSILPIRTVFDGRLDRPSRFLHQILLLTASWKHNVRDKQTFPLEIVILGSPASRLVDRLQKWGARVIFSEPHPMDPLLVFSNKLLASSAHGLESSTRYLFVDNDVCLFGEPRGLLPISPQTVMAAVADNNRISDDRWELIETQIRLVPKKRDWVPLNEEFRAACLGLKPLRVLNAYWNAGVILMPDNRAFDDLWTDHMRKITLFFQDHPLRHPSVYGEDQSGFATAAAAYGLFEDLPLAYNYRPSCFKLAKEPPDPIVCVHFVNWRDPSGLEDASTSRRLKSYWSDQIIQPLEKLRDPILRRKRIDFAVVSLDQILKVVTEYGIDRIARPL